jgi:hypothetical protein
MQEKANVSLSAFELQLVTDPIWILTKTQIIEKVYNLFGDVSQLYQQHQHMQQLPSALTALAPKISKGENYEGLPYVMLDYPRCFSREDVFAVRSFFWWGHYFSCTLHLKGVYKQQYEQRIDTAIKHDELNGWYLNTTDEEWNHHVHESMQLIHTDTDVFSKNIIKITAIHPLQQWNESFAFYESSINKLMKIIVA